MSSPTTKATKQGEGPQYNDFVGRTVLRSIRLIDSRFEMKPEALGTPTSAWRNSLSQQPGDAFIDEESGVFYGFIRFEMIARHRRKRIVTALAQYMVSYQVTGTCEQVLADMFVERVGRIAAYPYYRALVATLVSQAGIVMHPLPMISVAPRSLASARDLQEI